MFRNQKRERLIARIERAGYDLLGFGDEDALLWLLSIAQLNFSKANISLKPLIF